MPSAMRPLVSACPCQKLLNLTLSEGDEGALVVVSPKPEGDTDGKAMMQMTHRAVQILQGLSSKNGSCDCTF